MSRKHFSLLAVGELGRGLMYLATLNPSGFSRHQLDQIPAVVTFPRNSHIPQVPGFYIAEYDTLKKVAKYAKFSISMDVDMFGADKDEVETSVFRYFGVESALNEDAANPTPRYVNQ